MTSYVEEPFTIEYRAFGDVLVIRVENHPVLGGSVIPRDKCTITLDTKNTDIPNAVRFAFEYEPKAYDGITLDWTKCTSPSGARNFAEFKAKVIALYPTNFVGGGKPFVVSGPFQVGGTPELPELTWAYPAEDSTKRGAANGYASLDATGKVPASQLPSAAYEIFNTTTNASGQWTVTHGFGTIPRLVVGTVTSSAGTLTTQYQWCFSSATVTTATGRVTGPTAVLALLSLGTAFAPAGVPVTVQVWR